MGKKQAWTKVGDSTEVAIQLKSALGKAMSLVAKDTGFTCLECLDRGFVERSVVARGRRYRIVHHCSAPIDVSGRMATCKAADVPVFELRAAEEASKPESTNPAGKNAYASNERESSKTPPPPRQVSLRQVLPSESTARSWEERIMRMPGLDSSQPRPFVKPLEAPLVEAALEALESAMALGMSESAQISGLLENIRQMHEEA